MFLWTMLEMNTYRNGDDRTTLSKSISSKSNDWHRFCFCMSTNCCTGLWEPSMFKICCDECPLFFSSFFRWLSSTNCSYSMHSDKGTPNTWWLLPYGLGAKNDQKPRLNGIVCNSFIFFFVPYICNLRLFFFLQRLLFALFVDCIFDAFDEAECFL